MAICVRVVLAGGFAALALPMGCAPPGNSAAGEAAVAVVEIRNEQRDVLADVAILMPQRATRISDVESSGLAKLADSRT